jgi:DNA modification methylase
MRNKRSVWTIAVNGFKDAHFATFPQALIEPCILAGAPFDGLVLDPFTGSGTTAVTALQNGRNFIGVELNPKYVTMAQKRIKRDGHYQERMLTHG